jgi:drug/metabolite transporter (DMT)-like permease
MAAHGAAGASTPLVKGSLVVGVAAAVAATLAWSLNFLVPFVIGDYSIFDFALFQFLIPAALGAGFLAIKRQLVRHLPRRDWLVAFSLGLIGYLAYSLALVGAARYAGPVIAPAFLSSVPIVLAVIGNFRERTVSWKVLCVPLLLALVGLALINGSSLGGSHSLELPFLGGGILLAILAVACWVTFGLANQTALGHRPHMPTGIWSALILCGAGLGMLVVYPVGAAFGAFNIPQLGLPWETAHEFILWGLFVGVVVNVGGAVAWTITSQRLPVALSAQLITLEPTFGTIFGLSMRRRWPTMAELAGMMVLLAGVIVAVRIFHGGKAAPKDALSASEPV